MGRFYKTGFSNVAVTAGQDLIEILAPTDAVVVIHEYKHSQNTEVGDAQMEQLRIQEKRGVGAVTSGSGGSTHTPQPVEDGDPAFGGTVEINNTTRLAAGSGSIETFPEYAWNVLQPERVVYTPETRPLVSPGNRWALDLLAAPTDAVTMNLEVVLEEIGG